MSLRTRKPEFKPEFKSVYSTRHPFAQEEKRRDPMFSMMKIAATAIIIISAIMVLGGGAFHLVNQSSAGSMENCLVTSKEPVTYDGVNKYLLFTQNCDVLEVTDSIIVGRWDSSSVYNQIQVGKTYDFETHGKRIPLISSYPNVTGFTEVSAP